MAPGGGGGRVAPKSTRHYLTCKYRQTAPHICARAHPGVRESSILERRIFEFPHRWQGRTWEEKCELPLDDFNTFAMIEAVVRQVEADNVKQATDEMMRKLQEQVG